MPISYIKALQDFFSKPPHGKKIEITEFKDLSEKDKRDFREMLIAEGYEVDPIKEKVVE
jgi:hypothetical protein